MSAKQRIAAHDRRPLVPGEGGDVHSTPSAPTAKTPSVPDFELQARKRTPGRTGQRPPGREVEDALVAGALEAILLGLRDDGTGQVRALLSVGDETVGRDAHQDAGGALARVIEDLRAADRELVHGATSRSGRSRRRPAEERQRQIQICPATKARLVSPRSFVKSRRERKSSTGRSIGNSLPPGGCSASGRPSGFVVMASGSSTLTSRPPRPSPRGGVLAAPGVAAREPAPRAAPTSSATSGETPRHHILTFVVIVLRAEPELLIGRERGRSRSISSRVP